MRLVSAIPAGPELDYLMAYALRAKPPAPGQVPPYSTEWAAGGEYIPLLLNSGFKMMKMADDAPVVVLDAGHCFSGSTALEAVCRAVISLRLGPVIPDSMLPQEPA